MKLVLLRHGIAVDRADPDCPADEDRPLTGTGIRRTIAACCGLAALEVEPTVVLSSPLLRARQTAEIAAEVLDCPRIEVTDALRGGIHTREIFAVLRALDVTSAVCVGHAPHLDLVLAQAVRAGDAGLEKMKKAGAAMVEFEDVGPGLGRLVWQFQPRALRALGRD